MSEDIRYRTGNSDDRPVIREAERTNSYLEKSVKKPRRLSRLWKSLTHKKSSTSQPLSEIIPQSSLSAGGVSKAESPGVDLSCIRLSENNASPPVEEDIDLKTNEHMLAVSTFQATENNIVSCIHTITEHNPTPHVSACSIHEGAAKEEAMQPAPMEAETEVGTVHTQVDYVHYLVPDLKQIFNSSYYWGVMDRYEAEKLLETKPEGTFLLRDSAQEDFLFSVSFRRYNRSLHARIEQWEHKFSFDSHDSNVYSCKSVCGLIERYKDPSCLMFFEPMLTIPLPKTSPFSLQSLCRATLCSMLNYDNITRLPIPPTLMDFLQYYHYKQRVRVRRF